MSVPELIVIRPSMLSTLVNCPYKWYQTSILNQWGKSSVKASVGSSIHKGVEYFWSEYCSKDREAPASECIECGVNYFNNKCLDTEYDDTIANVDSAYSFIEKGVECFLSDIYPEVEKPTHIEHTMQVELPNNIKGCRVVLKGTADYISKSGISDIKNTWSRFQPLNYDLQLAAYLLLAQNDGIDIDAAFVQGIVFYTSRVEGKIAQVDVSTAQVKFLIKSVIKRLETLYAGNADVDTLFPGNPKYYLCQDKFCDFRANCPFVKGKNGGE